jgi:long-chain fatty acid transport protein
MKTLKHLLFAAIVGSPAVASANAFNINEHDARVTGRGGATAASNTGPSSIVFNPAGMAFSEGTSFTVNGTIYIAEGQYEPIGGGETTETDSAPSLVPSAYVTSRLHDMVAVGIGLHLPFGLHVSWPDNHAQAEVVQDQRLRTYFITPGIAISLNEQVPGLSIGAGVDIVPATVELEQVLVFGDARGIAELSGDALGFGGRVGIMYHPPALDQLKFGVMWRSSVQLDFKGQGDFDMMQPYRSELPPDGEISTSITLPGQVWGGVAFQALPQLEAELDIVWIDWSKFDELRIQLPGGAETVSPQNYQDKVTFRLGGEYKLEKQQAALRAGFIYDPTPIPRTTLTARLPDINRKNITLGASKAFGDLSANLGFLWVTPGKRTTSDELYMPIYKGEYGVQAFVGSLSLSGQFGQ